MCTVVQLSTSLWTVTRWLVWQRGRSILVRKGYVLIALVSDTEQQSVVSREVASFNGRHHTSICDKEQPQLLLTTCEDAVIYPVMVVNVDGKQSCQALLDSGAGSVYALAAKIKEVGLTS